MARRIDYPAAPYTAAYVTLPDEWLGEHLLKRNRAVEAANKYGVQQFTRTTIALAVAEDWGGIPGIESRDPRQWDLTKTPIAIMQWLVDVVFESFSRAFVVPKVSLSPSGNGSTMKAATLSTGGNSETTK